MCSAFFVLLGLALPWFGCPQSCPARYGFDFVLGERDFAWHSMEVCSASVGDASIAAIDGLERGSARRVLVSYSISSSLVADVLRDKIRAEGCGDLDSNTMECWVTQGRVRISLEKLVNWGGCNSRLLIEAQTIR
jgi:hypothetical protein